MNTANSEPAGASPVDLARRLHVFVLIDALGWEIIKDRPFLNDELPFRRPLETVLGYSSGAIPTILTGLHPAQTGHWNLYYTIPRGRHSAGCDGSGSYPSGWSITASPASSL